MSDTNLISADDIRSRFSAAMSEMYRTEVPAYGTLMDIVAKVNDQVLDVDRTLRGDLESTDQLARISEERHGAIRLGTPSELATMRRLFAVMGMQPVGYYDLTEAGVPVHSTAFRPVGDAALRRNPFRVFTSLLRLDLIEDKSLRDMAQSVLDARQIYTSGCLEMIELAEKQGGLTDLQADRFIAEALETFRWHPEANVSADLYKQLHDAHRLIADVVSFRGPHINHLTPRTLDIDRVQDLMPEYGITPKAVVEGPPRRDCPILLRQTSFKALSEAVSFAGIKGSHTARFGEIEARGQALTPKGRALYDQLLTAARAKCLPAAHGSNAAEYVSALAAAFADFPDNLTDIRKDGLGYFEWTLTDKGAESAGQVSDTDPDALLAAGYLRIDPIVYEDFLPVSAAGIFQSNLGDGSAQEFTASPNQQRFETDLGASVLNEFEHYQEIEDASRIRCISILTAGAAAAE
ncbi:VOC family protein [Donghicola sp. XS_ASV15]|uniref:2-oxoadipate dioxygenase/decarboxylase HglS n=1 Tax=Donghicola sp. XS_ASV15 TaxID=3241295 RepID=UPI003514D885